MLEEIQKDAEERMQKALVVLEDELKKMRTGRAHPSLLDQVSVDYYGAVTPINQLASISVGDARTLLITPWDKSSAPLIEKAIITSDLGLNPVMTGQLIRVPLPPLSEERRRDLVRVVRQEVEQARIAIRNIRRDANASCKDLLKEKMISEDEERRGQDKIQKLTDRYIKEADQVLEHKETELMAV